jgi:hypothetical protein
LRVDHAIARPNGIDVGARVEDLHRLGGPDPDQEDGVTEVGIRVLAETVGLVADDRPQLGRGEHENIDSFAVEVERRRQGGLDLRLDFVGRLVRPQHHVAARDIGRYVDITEALQEPSQAGHRHGVPATHIDPAQEDEIGRHAGHGPPAADASAAGELARERRAVNKRRPA